MWYSPQTFLGYKLAGGTAYAIGFVVDAYESCPQMVYKLALTLGQTCVCFAFEHVCSFFEGLEGGRCIGGIVAIGITQALAQLFVECCGGVYFCEYDLTEFLEFFIRVP